MLVAVDVYLVKQQLPYVLVVMATVTQYVGLLDAFVYNHI